ncbi:MAG: hypothetical protein NTZ95_01800 [Candidatus Omnitrophica bacterium]|nr:hypothetical protein [Candidatus Omnitrophota bacterium]
MKKILSIVIIFSFIFSSIAPAFAADATWNGTTDSLWDSATNWSNPAWPVTTNTATFNNAGNTHTTVDIDSVTGAAVKSIVFDTGAAAYVIGDGIHADTLTLDNLGVIEMTTGVLNNQTFNANIVLSSTPGIPGGAAFENFSSAKTLIFNGTVNSDGITPQDLTVAATTGNVEFNGAVGTINSLANLDIVNGRNITAAAITAETITQDDGIGTTTLNGAVNTSAAGGVNLTTKTIDINNSVTTIRGLVDLNATTAVTLDGGNITTTAGVNTGTTSGAIAIDVSGTGTVALAGSLDTTGAANSTGAGSIGGAVTVNTAGGVMAVDNITTTGGAGTGFDGGAAGLITLNTGGQMITLNGDLSAIGGASDTATGGAGATVTISDPATLGAAVRIDTSGGVGNGGVANGVAGNIDFQGTLNGTQILNLDASGSTDGDIHFHGIVGGTPLGAVTIDNAKDVTAFDGRQLHAGRRNRHDNVQWFRGLLRRVCIHGR